MGDPISQPADRPRLQRVLNYILRPALPLKHLSYVEATGQVRFSPPRSIPKVWEHAYDFLAYVTTVLCDAPVRLPEPEKKRGHLAYPRCVGRLSYQTITRFPTLFESRGSRPGVQGILGVCSSERERLRSQAGLSVSWMRQAVRVVLGMVLQRGGKRWDDNPLW